MEIADDREVMENFNMVWVPQQNDWGIIDGVKRLRV